MGTGSLAFFDLPQLVEFNTVGLSKLKNGTHSFFFVESSISHLQHLNSSPKSCNKATPNQRSPRDPVRPLIPGFGQKSLRSARLLSQSKDRDSSRDSQVDYHLDRPILRILWWFWVLWTGDPPCIKLLRWKRPLIFWCEGMAKVLSRDNSRFWYVCIVMKVDVFTSWRWKKRALGRFKRRD